MGAGNLASFPRGTPVTFTPTGRTIAIAGEVLTALPRLELFDRCARQVTGKWPDRSRMFGPRCSAKNRVIVAVKHSVATRPPTRPRLWAVLPEQLTVVTP